MTETRSASSTVAVAPVSRRRASSASSVPEDARQQQANGSNAVSRLAGLQRAADAQPAQRKVYTSGSKNPGSVTAPGSAVSVAKRSRQAKYNPGGANHVAVVSGVHGGYRMGKTLYVGGSVFANTAMPDGTFLPRSGGQSYTEWDVNAFVEGQGRGTERVVVSSDGRFYYTNDHYKNFSEFTI